MVQIHILYYLIVSTQRPNLQQENAALQESTAIERY